MNMKKGILLVAVILLSTVGFAQAQDELTGTIDVTYLSAYIWRGFDLNQGAHGEGVIQPSIDLDLYGTGFGLNVFWSRANTGNVNKGTSGTSGSLENLEELDLTLSYNGSLFDYETYATDYSVGWMYYDYPDNPKKALNAQEMFVSIAWPEICAEGAVPSYTLIRMWAAENGSIVNDLSGWLHVFGVGYDVPVEGMLPDIPEQILHFSVAAVYNEGCGAAGVDHDWSHAVFGVSTDFDLGNDLTLSPGVYYQSSWESTVNPSDETWCSLSVKYAF